MSQPPLRFRLPSKTSDRAVAEDLRQAWAVKPLDVSRSRRAYLDTADWRLLRAGWTLHCDSRESEPAGLVLCSSSDGTALARVTINGLPQWADDIPDGEPWQRVGAAIDERRLLCQLNLDCIVKRFAVLDDEAKTTARVSFERHLRAGDGTGSEQRLRMVTVTPLRGYERYAIAISKLFTDRALRPVDGSVLQCFRDAPEPSTAGVARSQTLHELDTERSLPVATEVGRVLSRLREEMVENEPGVRDQVDIEFLHDFRVASRRARSVLNQVRALFPGGEAEVLSSELQWLGSVTGPVRDLDVQISQARHDLADLKGLAQMLTRKREEAQSSLVAALDSPRYKALLEAWIRLENVAAKASQTHDGARPAGDVMDRYVYRAHRRVLRIGKGIHEESPAEALHDLRKKTKALRYLLEMFSSLYRGSDLKAAVRELKALQDNLGEFQDTQVQANAIWSLAEEMLVERVGSASELMAMGRIADALEVRQARARDEFAARFERFSSHAVTARYRRMFGSQESR
ncbi:MAG TPA: CHAD domain-containing protein [Acidimicrobiales bacterium]|nr:CHAD domain-containing protein [Acidimicrobiales bacterium]